MPSPTYLPGWQPGEGRVVTVQTKLKVSSEARITSFLLLSNYKLNLIKVIYNILIKYNKSI